MEISSASGRAISDIDLMLDGALDQLIEADALGGSRFDGASMQ
jgi:hypothetical protein